LLLLLFPFLVRNGTSRNPGRRRNHGEAQKPTTEHNRGRASLSEKTHPSERRNPGPTLHPADTLCVTLPRFVEACERSGERFGFGGEPFSGEE